MATRVRPKAKDIPIGCTVAPANTAVPSPAKINTNVPNSSAVYFIDVPLHQKSSRECRHSTTPFFVSRSKVAQLRQNTRDVKEAGADAFCSLECGPPWAGADCIPKSKMHQLPLPSHHGYFAL